jgi:hypothetical protein
LHVPVLGWDRLVFLDVVLGSRMYVFAVQRCLSVPLYYVFAYLGVVILSRALLKSLEAAERPDKRLHR